MHDMISRKTGLENLVLIVLSKPTNNSNGPLAHLELKGLANQDAHGYGHANSSLNGRYRGSTVNANVILSQQKIKTLPNGMEFYRIDISGIENTQNQEYLAVAQDELGIAYRVKNYNL